MNRIITRAHVCALAVVLFCAPNAFAMKQFKTLTIDINPEAKNSSQNILVGPATVVHEGQVGNKPGSSLLLTNRLLAMGVNKEIKIFDLKTGEVTRSFDHGDWVSHKDTGLLKLAGNFIASFDTSIVKVWDVKDGSCKNEIEVNNGYPEFIIGILGINKQRIASYSCVSPHVIEIRSLVNEKGPIVGVFEGHKDKICDVLKITDKYIASGSYDRTVKVWDLETGKCVYNLLGHGDRVLKLVKISDDVIASGDSNGDVKIWDLKNGTCKQILAGKKGQVNKLIVSSNKIIVCHKGGDMQVWGWKTGKFLKNLTGHMNNVRDLIVVNDKILISCSKDGTIKVWDLNKGVWAQSIFCGDIINKIFVTTMQSVPTLVAVTWDGALITCPCKFTSDNDNENII